MITNTTPLRVMSLHALLYCERLFYLEEIEEIRVADTAVYAGRRLHEEVVPMDDETPEHRSLELASETLGLMGKVEAVRKRDGKWIAYGPSLTRRVVIWKNIRSFRKRNWLTGMREQEFQFTLTTT